MTWKEFKELMEKYGIKDDTELLSIDWNGQDKLELYKSTSLQNFTGRGIGVSDKY